MSTTSPDFVHTPQPDNAEIAAKITSLLCISVLAVLFGIKTHNVQYRYLSYSRWLILMLYILSWGFTAISMVLVTTNNANYTSCFLSVMLCDIFYSATKLVIYAWLVEKVYLVSSVRQTRWQTKSYRIHVVCMMPYIGILSLMLVYHTAELEAAGVCIIGLQFVAALPLIIYDFTCSLYLTILFIRPLIKLGEANVRDKRQQKLHDVALRTLVASVVCLVVSFANILSLQILQGRERGLICLTSCTADIIINVITIHWVTSQSAGRKHKDTSQLDDESPVQIDRETIIQEFTSLQILENQPGLGNVTPMDDRDGSTGIDSKSIAKESLRAMSKPTDANKYEDRTSTDDDSVLCTASSHASQNSRRSLTK